MLYREVVLETNHRKLTWSMLAEDRDKGYLAERVVVRKNKPQVLWKGQNFFSDLTLKNSSCPVTELLHL